ncbi:cathepsin S-like [Discoglossus pictus]
MKTAISTSFRMHLDKRLLAFSIILVCTSASHFLDQEWNTWKSKYGKGYITLEDELLRRQNWEANWDRVQKHNKLADQGLKSFWMAMNQFGDMTPEEINSRSCLLSKGVSSKPTNASKNSNVKYTDMPEKVDWRDSNCVTPVKNQGEYCGSCWAFATIGVIESLYCIKTGELPELSEQHLVDCDKKDSGCCGGFPVYALEYISHYGVMREKDYEYTEKQFICKYDPDEALQVNVSKYYILPGEDNMAAVVAHQGPITVGFGVSFEFFFYSNGIYDGGCASAPNHAIIIVGYGTEEGDEEEGEEDTDYWIIKNSWGESWGEEGYGNIKRNVNLCDIAEMAATADIKV